ncbi:MAG: amidohydrolase family protein, partial [Pseudomonadales bacterium]
MHLRLIALLLLPALAFAKPSTWDVNDPPGERLRIPIDTRSGTWMNVDVSPDGRHIAFDLLGDVYELPISGGDARRLTEGLAWDMQPRYSPDGTHLAFTSDRGGADNLWLLHLGDPTRARAAKPVALTKETFRLLNAPAWHPGGRYIAGRKHFTTRRSLGTGEIWLYDRLGGEGIALVERPNDRFQKELGEPAFSADGRYLFYTQNTSPGNVFEYAQDSNRGVFSILRFDLEDRETDTVVTGAGGAVRPTPSPDGRLLAFVQRERRGDQFHSALYVKDLVSGHERRLFAPLDRDMQEGWAVHGVYPNMAWLPDSSALIFWSGGEIRRVDLGTGTTATIPFRVKDEREAIRPFRGTVEVAPPVINTRMARFPVLSPDGRTVVFETFGKLWRKELPNGTPERLTTDASNAFEFYPAFSRDGREIAFVRWTDKTLGAIHVVAATGGAGRAITTEPGHYRTPQFSPDGSGLVYTKAAGGYLTAPDWSEDTGVFRISLASGDSVRVTREGQDAHFGKRGDRIYLTRKIESKSEPGPVRALVSVNLNGHDEQVVARSNYATHLFVSPDDEWITFREDFAAWAVPKPPAGELTLAPDDEALTVIRVSSGGGEFVAWSHTNTLTYALGPNFYAADLAALVQKKVSTTAEAISRSDRRRKDASSPGKAIGTLTLTRAADTPTGRLALTNGRIITLSGDSSVIDRGTVLIDGNRITAIGPVDQVQIPNDAQTLDVGGRTLMPGLIDAHAHGAQGENGLIPQQNWEALAHLALGVTTMHDPSNDATEIFAAAEYQRAGLITAPRIFSTGNVVYGARSEGMATIETLKDALAHVERLKAQGAISIKNYNQPRRDQRQMVVTAAREAGLSVVAEGGSLYTMDVTLLQDGNTGLEHNMPGERFYDDIMQLWPATGVGYTPTLVVTYGGPGAEHLFYQRDEVWRHPLLSRFVPPHILEPRAVRRIMAPDSDYQPVIDSAANAAALARRGIPVSIG